MADGLLMNGKVAMVTGSTRGIGWATALALAGAGATVIINGRTDSELLETRVKELRDRHGPERSHGICFDQGDPAQIKAAFQAAFKIFKRLDVLVNNAGILEDGLIGMLSDDLIARTFQVNAIGVAHCMQAGVRIMQRQGGGSIVNLSSIIGVRGNAGQLAYAGSKAAVIGMTLSAAKELAPKNIRVNAVAPGFIDTDMVRSLPPDKFRERTASIKMGRIGRPEEVANAVLFLASDQSSYVTGQVLGVDGGMLI